LYFSMKREIIQLFIEWMRNRKTRNGQDLNPLKTCIFIRRSA